MRARAPCKPGLASSAWTTNRSSCGSLKAVHQSAATAGPASALRPSVAVVVSGTCGVVGGAATQPPSAYASGRARIAALVAPIRAGSPDSRLRELNQDYSFFSNDL